MVPYGWEILFAEILKISSVQEGEAFLIQAGWEILSEKKWRCEACVSSTIEAQRDVKGCKGGKKYRLADYIAKACIGNFYHPSVFLWYRAYSAFKRGVLPESGGLMEQPAKWLEIFQMFENLESEAEEKARRQAEQKAAKNGRK